MKTIWKYQLFEVDEQIIRIPIRGEILSVQCQGEQICLWVMVRPDEPMTNRTIEVLGTGNPIPETDKPFSRQPIRAFIGTVQMPTGLVWHIFEKGRI